MSGEAKRPRTDQACPICGAQPYLEHSEDCKWHPANPYGRWPAASAVREHKEPE